MTILPKEPWTLIRLAVDGLIKCEESENYIIDMNYWHIPKRSENLCVVCMAGSVIAMTLNRGINENVSLGNIEDENCNQIRAIDCFRIGNIYGGLMMLGMKREAQVESRYDRIVNHGRMLPPCYGSQKDLFKMKMLILAEYLEAQYKARFD